MRKKEVWVRIPNGMEASPVALLVQTANKFKSSIYLEYGNARVNAKSIMGMLSLRVDYEEKIVVEVEGEDEEEALKAMEAFLTGGK